MVRVLIALRRTILRHQAARTNQAVLLVTAALVLASALGTIWLGLVRYPSPAAATSVLALVFTLWLGGRTAQTALASDPVLRPELFSLLPLPRRRLAFSLLAVGGLDPAGLFTAVALTALIARGARLGILPALIGLAAVILTLVLASVLATVAGGVLGPGSRRGHDTGTIITAVAISALAVAGTLLPAIASALRNGSVPWLAFALRVLPTGWGPAAVEAAARGDWLEAAGNLAALAVLAVAVAACWPSVLTRRMNASAHLARSGTSHRDGRALLPRTPAGAVAAKELRLWGRDPIRLTCLLIAVLVGAAACAIPRVTAGTSVVLPYAGILTTVIASACACNLYGSDGTSLWLTVMTPGWGGAARRGRPAPGRGLGRHPRPPGGVADPRRALRNRDYYRVHRAQRPARGLAVGAGHRAGGAGRRGRAGSARVAAQRPAPRRDRQSHPGLVAEGADRPVRHRPHRPCAGPRPGGGLAVAPGLAVLGRRAGRPGQRHLAGRRARPPGYRAAGAGAGPHPEGASRRGPVTADRHGTRPGRARRAHPGSRL
jgi:ABC-2 type transport system permease protein